MNFDPLRWINEVRIIQLIQVFTGFFSMGLGGIPWIIMAEVSEKFGGPNYFSQVLYAHRVHRA